MIHKSCGANRTGFKGLIWIMGGVNNQDDAFSTCKLAGLLMRFNMFQDSGS